jgi:hypothetical protein
MMFHLGCHFSGRVPTGRLVEKSFVQTSDGVYETSGLLLMLAESPSRCHGMPASGSEVHHHAKVTLSVTA